MKRPDHVPIFSKALLSGALTGMAATVINMIYDVAFRGITKYYPAEEFNFFSITLATMLVLMIIGLLFFVFVKYINRTAFIFFMIAVIVGSVCITAFVHSNANESAFYGNHGLIAGFTILSGLLSLTLLPYLYNHPRIYI